MIKPDPREVLWYDINNILMMEPDMIPHYWTILIDKVRMLDDNIPRPLCLQCNSSLDLFEFEDKIYCNNGYDFIRERLKDGSFKITSVQKKTQIEHPIIYETMRESLNRILNWIFAKLEESSGYKFDLMDLEDYTYAQPKDGLFETKTGDVRKGNILKWMYQLKKPILSRMIELRQEIRFSSTMRTPSISVR